MFSHCIEMLVSCSNWTPTCIVDGDLYCTVRHKMCLPIHEVADQSTASLSLQFPVAVDSCVFSDTRLRCAFPVLVSLTSCLSLVCAFSRVSVRTHLQLSHVSESWHPCASRPKLIAENHATLWKRTGACYNRLARLISDIHHTGNYKQH